MKKILLILTALVTTGPSLAKQCCKDNNHNCCDTHRICPAGTSEPCEGACLPDKPKTEVTAKTTHHKKTHHKHVKKHKKHAAHHKQIKKHHETTVR